MVALEFSLNEAKLAQAEERAFRRLAKNVRAPGFRKGKIPRKLFEQTYGTATLTNEAVDEVIPEIYAEAIREHDLEPVERPKFEVVEESAGRPTRLKATVEVRPAITLGRYRGVTVSRPAFKVTDAEVDSALDSLARERATLVPSDRPARLGDVAIVDYVGTIDGQPFEGGSAQGQTVELSEKDFIPGFAGGIVDMKPGETKEIELVFPSEYPAAEVAGKPVIFTITLHELKAAELPALDDEFAKGVSENQTLAQLKQDLRRRLEAVAHARARRMVGNAVLSQLMASHDFPLPESLVERELEQLVAEAPSGGSEAEVSARRQALRRDAESHVKAALLIQAIAKAENLTATPAEVTAELEALARRYGQPVSRIRNVLGNTMHSLIDGIVRNKTLDLLIDSAVVTIDEETTTATS